MAETDDDVRFGFYLDAYMDRDPMPFTLDGWAKFLAGSADWHGVDHAGVPLARDGDLLTGHRMTFRYAPATHGADGWEIPEPPPGHVYHAVAYGPRDGWDEDGMGETLTEILGVLLRCDTDGEQWIVFRQTTETDLTLRFCASGPSLVEVQVQ